MPSRKTPSTSFPRREERGPFSEAVCHLGKPFTTVPGWRAACASLSSALSWRGSEGEMDPSESVCTARGSKPVLGNKGDPQDVLIALLSNG